jgi:type I restriction enzyme S subunit
VTQVSSLCQITSSKRIFESEYKKEGVPFYRAGEIKQKKEGVIIKELLYISEDKFLKISKSFGHPLPGDILLTAVGSLLGDSYLVENETFYFKDGNVVWFRRFVIEGCNLYLYEYLQSESFRELLDEIKIGSGQSAITIHSLNEKRIIKPSDMILKAYQKVSSCINNEISQCKKQNSKLYELKDLLLSKLATIEN